MIRIGECILLLVCGEAFCFGQQATSTAGGESDGAGGSVSFTVGQTVYVSSTGSDGAVFPGVQQPYEILVETGNETEKDILLNCVAYPNPATDMLILKIQGDRLEKLSYMLMDINGKILDERAIENTETSISLQHDPSSTYFLQVRDHMKVVKIFKIIKN